jgi:hypothetical protein
LQALFVHGFKTKQPIMKNLVTNGFKRYTVIKLLGKARYILKQMLEQQDLFPSPDPSLAELAQRIDELTAANFAAESSDRIKLVLLKDKKREMVDFLQDLGMYVNMRAKGNRTIAMSSGFDVVKTKEPRVLVDAGVIRLLRGRTIGELEAKIKGQVAAINYTWYITTDDKKPLHDWDQLKNESSSRVVFKNMTPGTRYYVLVELRGTRKQSVMSQMATVVA